MASSKGSPGPHDRKAGVPRTQCIAQTRAGKRCQRFTAHGHGKLCKFHRDQAEALRRGERTGPANPVDPSLADVYRGGLTQFVINVQAKAALAKIGLEPSPGFDPKTALMATVESSWRQQRAWEAMLASVPEEDFAHIGVVPIPGQMATSRGARIEIIQKFLGESTKNAARVSKLAIDAGIEERLVRLAEEQSALIADTVKAAILAAVAALASQLRLDPTSITAAQDRALGAAAGHLRMLAAGGQDIVEGIAVRVGQSDPHAPPTEGKTNGAT